LIENSSQRINSDKLEYEKNFKSEREINPFFSKSNSSTDILSFFQEYKDSNTISLCLSGKAFSKIYSFIILTILKN